MRKAHIKSAIVVGAGIGGLTAALCLRRAGVHVRVLERAQSAGDVGAGIQLSPNAMRVLSALGIDAAIQRSAVAPTALTMRRGVSGSRVFSIPVNDSRADAPYWHVHRADLVDALVRAVNDAAPDAIVFAADVADCDPDSGAVTLADGRCETADLIVGADGIRSIVRRSIDSNMTPTFTGNVAWRMTVPTQQLSPHAPAQQATVWTGAGRHAVTYQLRAGSLCNLVGVVETDDWREESWQSKGTRSQALSDFNGWHPTVTRLIEKADTHYRWALYERPPMTAWHRNRAVLIGDACHAMLPFMAQGAAMAIEDAWVLAALLQKDQPTDHSLREFYSERAPRTTRVQNVARDNAGVFHRRSALTQFGTYLPMTLASIMMPGAIARRLDWLYNKDVVNEHPII